MRTETPALLIDPNLRMAARILAMAETKKDGWVRAEDLDGLRKNDSLIAEPAVTRWAQLLEALLRDRPGVQVVVDGTEGYPNNLRTVAGRPALLLLDGIKLPEDDRALAVVGSRRATDDALAATSMVAGEFARRDYTVVSGLARGIDTAAHKGALAVGGRTIAVVGTGIDEVFPPENGGFIESVRKAGFLLSQFPPGYGPTKTTFPARNAVIAGMSLGSLVVTASERSGTRIEIDRSLAQGRPVFLWEPFLGSQPWAQELASDDLVNLISSVDEVDEVLQKWAAV